MINLLTGTAPYVGSDVLLGDLLVMVAQIPDH